MNHFSKGGSLFSFLKIVDVGKFILNPHQKPNQFTLLKMDAHELFVPRSKSMHQKDRHLDIKVS